SDRNIHRAYGLPELQWVGELRNETERHATQLLLELGIEAPTGRATAAFIRAGFEMTAEDDAEMKRPLLGVGYFLVMPDGLIRYACVEERADPVPNVDEILRLV